jgi:hypothetical protein
MSIQGLIVEMLKVGGMFEEKQSEVGERSTQQSAFSILRLGFGEETDDRERGSWMKSA